MLNKAETQKTTYPTFLNESILLLFKFAKRNMNNCARQTEKIKSVVFTLDIDLTSINLQVANKKNTNSERETDIPEMDNDFTSSIL